MRVSWNRRLRARGGLRRPRARNLHLLLSERGSLRMEDTIRLQRHLLHRIVLGGRGPLAPELGAEIRAERLVHSLHALHICPSGAVAGVVAGVVAVGGFPCAPRGGLNQGPERL